MSELISPALTTTTGVSHRQLLAWRYRASASFPVPASPRRRIAPGSLLSIRGIQTSWISRRSAIVAGDLPMTAPGDPGDTGAAPPCGEVGGSDISRGYASTPEVARWGAAGGVAKANGAFPQHRSRGVAEANTSHLPQQASRDAPARCVSSGTPL